MKVLKLMATILSLGVAGVGLLGAIAPAVLIQLALTLMLPPALYAVAAVRIAYGALLFTVAAASGMPRLLSVVGAFILVAGLLTPFLPTGQFADALVWFSGERLALFRAFALVPVAIGLFFAYAINAGHQ